MPKLIWISLIILLAVSCSGPAATPPPPDTAVATLAHTETAAPPADTPAPTPTETRVGTATRTATPSRTPAETATLEATATVDAGAESSPAVAAILDYLETRAKADVAGVSDLSCAAWRSQAVTEAISFRAMQAVLQDVNCQEAGSDGAFTLVTCDGTIQTTYGAEQREWDLAGFVYKSTIEDGAWKMCGYQL